MAKTDRDEREILKSYESGEWRRIKNLRGEIRKAQGYARYTFKKDKNINIRISSRDLDGIRKKSFEEGIPYQTLISSVLHKYVAGTIRPVR